jgi:hypothetical protein
VFAEKTYLMLQLLKHLKNEAENAGRVRDTYDVPRKARRKDDIVLDFLLQKGFRRVFLSAM